MAAPPKLKLGVAKACDCGTAVVAVDCGATENPVKPVAVAVVVD